MFNYSPQLYINGQWKQATKGKQFEVVNPATEEVIAMVSSADKDDTSQALESSNKAFKTWSKTPARTRSEILIRTYNLMLEQADKLAELITLENGKSIKDSLNEVLYGADFFRWFAEEAVRLNGTISKAPQSNSKLIVQHKPAGIAMLITPWNFPIAMATRKLAPALAAGCTTLLKPAKETPLSSAAIIELLTQAGLPPGVTNLLPTNDHSQVVPYALNDPNVRVVSFTGSTYTGKKILQEASNQLLNSALELGGNAPFIVFDEADLNQAVSGCILAKMRSKGEACTSANRIFVQEGIANKFIKEFTQAMSQLKVGNGLEKDVDIGPLINKKARNKIHSLVEDAKSKGGKVILGGKIPPGKGSFYPPTIITELPSNARCLKEEIFGPIAAIKTFRSTNEVIALANDTKYGLVGYIFTTDLKKGLQISESLEFGMIGLNKGIVSDPAAPFGGVKQSGLGREGGHEGILEFTETQYIITDW